MRYNKQPACGYCTADCDEMTDEVQADALCAYHRDHQEGPVK